MNNCIFCELIKGNIKSRKIYESKHSLAVLDAFPLKEGHTLIISKSHKSKIQELSLQEVNDIFSTTHFLVGNIEKAMDSKSTLIAIHNGEDAGQEIPHVHIHIIPIKKSGRKIAIHSMFDKKHLEENELDNIWKKIIKEIPT